MAQILDFGASLTDFGLLVSHSGAWTPFEDSEWASTYLALAPIDLFSHSDVRVTPQARLALENLAQREDMCRLPGYHHLRLWGIRNLPISNLTAVSIQL